LRPSLIVIEIHDVGTFFRNRTGGSRGHSFGSSITSTIAGFVGPSLRRTPRRSACIASPLISRST